jgi:hypothetical protein
MCSVSGKAFNPAVRAATKAVCLPAERGGD